MTSTRMRLEENGEQVEPDLQDSGPPTPTTQNSCSPVEDTPVTANPKRTPAKSTKRINDKCDTVLDTIEQHFKTPKPKEDRYDILGKNVALKIRDIPDNLQRLLAEKIINDAFFMAETGQLIMAHSIRESAPTHSASTFQHFSTSADVYSQHNGATYFQLRSPDVVSVNSSRSTHSLASFVSNFSGK